MDTQTAIDIALKFAAITVALRTTTSTGGTSTIGIGTASSEMACGCGSMAPTITAMAMIVIGSARGRMPPAAPIGGTATTPASATATISRGFNS